MIPVTIEVKGKDELLGNLSKIWDRFKNWRPVGDRFFELMRSMSDEIFTKEGAAFGMGSWAPLDSKKPLQIGTQEQRELRLGYYKQSPTGGAGPAHPILHWTGLLRRSLTKAKARGSIARIDKESRSQGMISLVFGSSLKTPSGSGWSLAWVHHFGWTPAGPERWVVPQREEMYSEQVDVIVRKKIFRDVYEVTGEML